jgi:hypothetical protein
MKTIKEIRLGAVLAAILGLFIIGLSAFLEYVALSENEGTFVHYCAAISGKFFTTGVVLLVGFGFELYRSKSQSRISKLEEELMALKTRTA